MEKEGLSVRERSIVKYGKVMQWEERYHMIEEIFFQPIKA